MSNLKNLFYSKKEAILFHVAGYTDNSESVSDIVEMLMFHSKALSVLDKNYQLEDVKTFYVTKSSRYKNMRVFYLKTSIVPKGTFELDGDWTMMKWIEN